MSEPAVEEYTIGWICALQEEYEAGCRMLDDEYDGPETAEINDNNTYVFGRVAGHNVVVGCLPHGRYGTSSAASVARDMIRSFPNLKFALMVGIGGGAPTRERDIRLGDVVVSVPQGGLGGVVQYDFGKRLTGGRFQQTGQLNSPPEVLLGALPEMQRRHNDPRKPDKVAEHIRLMDDMADYRRPVDDGLYRADYEHKGGESCTACEAAGLEQRSPRGPGREVVVHYGIIASANSVMKNAVERDQYAKDSSLNVLCFEMEAGGLMNNFPCLVIRGICDYSDSHKNDCWHKYAALAAAAYTRELLYILKPRKVAALAPWVKMEGLLEDIQERVQSVIHHQHTLADEMILKWLTPISYGPQQSDFLKRRQPGSGQWLLDSDEYQTWLKTSHQALFCPGIPGAGKTILTAVVVNELFNQFQRNADVGIAYIYLNFKRWDEQKVEHLLASLLKQLIQERSLLLESVKIHHEDHKKKETRPLLDEISRVLQSVAASYSRTFIVIDALDECQVLDGCRNKFLSEIFILQHKCGANIFATSRFLPEIMTRFNGNPTLEIRANNDDIQRYLESHLAQLSGFLANSLELQEEMTNAIVRAADGMFLLAHLHLNSLTVKTSPKAIRIALKTLPTGSDAYDHAYKDAMERIEDQHSERESLGKRIISWITCARRPLTTSELQQALAVEPGTSVLDSDNLPTIELMISACAGLVTIDEENDIIRLVHYTTQEYFQRTQKHWFPDAETDITKICVTYLSFDIFASGYSPWHFDFSKTEHWQISDTLFYYAAGNWGHHARMSSIEGDEFILGFLKSDLSACTQVMLSFGSDAYLWKYKRETRMSALHVTAYFGLQHSTAALLDEHYTPSLRDFKGFTPLHYAAEDGYHEVAKLLLDERADPNSPDNSMYRFTPLNWASINGDLEMVKLLLDSDADPNIYGDGYCGLTPLDYATKNRHFRLVGLLIDRGADPNLRGSDENGATPLYYATKDRHLELVKLLIDGGADPNIRGTSEYGATPLCYATMDNNLEMVNLLLDRDADPNIVDCNSDYGTPPPLYYAMKNSHLEMVKLLIDRGADPNFRGGSEYGTTPLCYATKNRHLELFKLLIDGGADPNVRGTSENGATPLCYATMDNNLEMVNLLLDRDADPNIVDNSSSYSTAPLCYAAKNGNMNIVRLLVDRGANPNIQDHHGSAPLHYATKNGHLKLVKLLLETNANPNMQDQYGLTPLHYATKGENRELVGFMLDNNADPTIECHDGLTPLSYAMQTGCQKLVDLLVNKAARHDIPDRKRPRLQL